MLKNLPEWPGARTFRAGQPIPAGSDIFLICLENFNVNQHSWFLDLIRCRIQIEIHYDSMYGGEGFKIVSESWPWPNQTPSSHGSPMLE
ncbi:hypothetical protein ACN3XK_70145 [Actinomadura welshii]